MKDSLGEFVLNRWRAEALTGEVNNSAEGDAGAAKMAHAWGKFRRDAGEGDADNGEVKD